ncbi:DoxX family protein [Pedobacter sp.]|uniref:DoxX family protein n=1 Tax=Pedobacter sp. TaxID=1411316 RepID=UPI003D7F53B6
MKRIFNTNYNHQSLDFGLLIFRVGFASIMLMQHGWKKLGVVLGGGEIQFGDPVGLGMTASFYLVIFAEVFCSLLVILGLFTRLAVIPLIIAMSVACFIAHSADPFSRQEPSLMFLIAFIFLLFSGPGRYSIDSIISRNTNKRRTF